MPDTENRSTSQSRDVHEIRSSGLDHPGTQFDVVQTKLEIKSPVKKASMAPAPVEATRSSHLWMYRHEMSHARSSAS